MFLGITLACAQCVVFADDLRRTGDLELDGKWKVVHTFTVSNDDSGLEASQLLAKPGGITHVNFKREELEFLSDGGRVRVYSDPIAIKSLGTQVLIIRGGDRKLFRIDGRVEEIPLAESAIHVFSIERDSLALRFSNLATEEFSKLLHVGDSLWIVRRER